MTVKFTQCFSQISEVDIEAVERQQDIKFPTVYRQFLLEHNGGKPSPDVFLISEREGEDRVRIFYGIAPDEDYGLLDNIKDYLGRIPADLIPIGRDYFGNLICLGIQGESFEKIYFWDHDWEVVEETVDYRNVTLVANTFSEFLENLYCS